MRSRGGFAKAGLSRALVSAKNASCRPNSEGSEEVEVPSQGPGSEPTAVPPESQPSLAWPVVGGDQGPESAPSQPLVPASTTGANTWLGAWAFLMHDGHVALYAKGKCAEIRKVPPHPELRSGEPVAVLYPCRGVKDMEGQLCHRIWGMGRWGGCESVRQANLPQHFQHHRLSPLQLRRELGDWPEDVWMWTLVDLQPLQASEYVALGLGAIRVGPLDMIKLPDQPAKVVSDPLARMASTGCSGESKSLCGH